MVPIKQKPKLDFSLVMTAKPVSDFSQDDQPMMSGDVQKDTTNLVSAPNKEPEEASLYFLLFCLSIF